MGLPQGVAVDAQGRILVADRINRVARFAVAGDGTVSFDRAFGIDVDPSDGNTGDFENCTTASTLPGRHRKRRRRRHERPARAGRSTRRAASSSPTRSTTASSVSRSPATARSASTAPSGSGSTPGREVFENCTTASGCQTGIGSDAAGGMSYPQGVAVDAQGRILVGDDNYRVDRFAVAGDGTVGFDRGFGIDVDPSDGDTGDFENCTTASGCRFGSSPSDGAGGIVDPAGARGRRAGPHPRRRRRQATGSHASRSPATARSDSTAPSGSTSTPATATPATSRTAPPRAAARPAPQSDAARRHRSARRGRGRRAGPHPRRRPGQPSRRSVLARPDRDRDQGARPRDGPGNVRPARRRGRGPRRSGQRAVRRLQVADGVDVTISEQAAGGQLSDYDTTIDCGGGPQSGTSLTVTNVTANVDCTITNTRKAPAPPPGGAGDRAAGPAIDTIAPLLSSASLTNTTFAVRPRGAAETPVAARAKRGTVFRYTLSEDARVVFTIERATVGRRVGGSCRMRTRSNRKPSPLHPLRPCRPLREAVGDRREPAPFLRQDRASVAETGQVPGDARGDRRGGQPLHPPAAELHGRQAVEAYTPGQ